MESVVVHPTVLLSILDHYKRIVSPNIANSNQRVVGVLLGSKLGGTVRATNSFALPFEEDEFDENIWFLDHNYLENMFSLFRKVNSKERIIGWYHTGPSLRISDLKIDLLFKKYITNPVLVIVPPNFSESNFQVPTNAYMSVEEISSTDQGLRCIPKFAHLPSAVDCEEAEEIGVEHLLRDTKDVSIGDLSTKIQQKLVGLEELEIHLQNVLLYLNKVANSNLPLNHQILYNLQNIFNLMPNVGGELNDLNSSMILFNNNCLMMNYISSLTRSIISLHSLIDNKISLKQEQKKQNE